MARSYSLDDGELWQRETWAVMRFERNVWGFR